MSIAAILKKWAAPAAAAGAATQSEESDASLLGILAKNGSMRGAKAAKDVFNEQMSTNPEMFTDIDQLMLAGNAQSHAARKAGDSRQGWFVGADGKPRYEISDTNATIDGGFTKGIAQRIMDQMPEDSHFPVPLGKFLTHDSLFNAYPDLQELPVFLRHPRDFDAIAGYHSPGEGLDSGAISMNLGPILGDNRTEMTRSLMHEIQHAIQNKEGFARGANATTAIDDVENYVTSPLREGAGLSEALLDNKLPKFEKLLEMANDGTEAGREFGDELAYYLSAGEAEARAVEKRLRMPARLRASDDGHPYGDMNLPDYMLPEGSRGPTLFEMIEMMRRDAP